VPAKVTQDDEKIIRSVVEWNLLTPTEIRALIGGRHIVAVRNRLRVLGHEQRKRGKWLTEGLGYLSWIDQPEDKWGERIFYAAQPALDLAYRRGWISQPMRAVERKRSNSKLVHDRLVIAYRFALHQKYGAQLHATTHHYNLFQRFGEAENEKVNADLFFYLDSGGAYPSFFVEWENTAEHSYDDKRRVSGRVLKAEAYADYFERGFFQEKFRYPDGRVIFVIPSTRQAENFARKLHEAGGSLNSRRFWITDFDGALGPADAKVYITPKDYEHARYSLDDTRELR
jgi:hypothetical protein